MKIKSVAPCAALVIILLASANLHSASARQRSAEDRASGPTAGESDVAGRAAAGSGVKPASVEERLSALERIIEEQQREIQALRATIERGSSASSSPAAA